MQLKEIKSQENAIRTLKRALLSGKVPHAYIFSGPAGVGKKLTALIPKPTMPLATSTRTAPPILSNSPVDPIPRTDPWAPLGASDVFWFFFEGNDLKDIDRYQFFERRPTRVAGQKDRARLFMQRLAPLALAQVPSGDLRHTGVRIDQLQDTNDQ